MSTSASIHPWALILAAGQGRRLAAATGGTAKQFLLWRGVPLFWHAARAMSRSASVAGLVFVMPQEGLPEAQEYVTQWHRREDLGLPWLVTAGGPQRQDSVRCGCDALPAGVTHVLIHDAARPFLSPGLVRRVCAALAEGAVGVIPVLPVTDTIKIVTHGRVTATLPRQELAAVQTPQGFALDVLRAAQAHAAATGLSATDDATLLEALHHAVQTVPGEAANMKITLPEDLLRLREADAFVETRTGMGYDVHRYGSEGHPLILGGLPIPGAPKVLAHSDGDVLLHALMDALLGCACLDDIGRHFPDSEPRYAGISSAILLHHTLDLVRDAGLSPCHADLTVVAQIPRLAPYRDAIRKNIAHLLQLPCDHVNLKATTEEGLGFTGRVEGIKAFALVTAQCRQGSR